MRISAAFPSKYLKAADLQGRRVPVIISHVDMEDLGDGELKPVLYFQGKQKGVVLNKTNANAIAMVYGDDTDAWASAPIELFEAQVSFQGRVVPGIRIHVPRIPPAARSAPPQAPIIAPSAPAASPVVNGGNGSHKQPVGTVTVDDEIPF